MSLASQLTSAFSAVATAINGKAPKANPSFTGTTAAPTPTAGDSTTKIATTAFVNGNVRVPLVKTRTEYNAIVSGGTLVTGQVYLISGP